MSALVTASIVLHAFDYLESSRIYRLATRDAGLQSVLARGARSSRVRFGSALGLFSTGTAHITTKHGRDLHILNSFEVHDSRPALAADYERFLGASVIAELLLRFSGSDTSDTGGLFDVLSGSLDALSSERVEEVAATTIGLAWRVVSEMGFSPSLVNCANCHSELDRDEDASFNHRLGGVLCSSCSRGQRSDRSLPASARDWLGGWIMGEVASVKPLGSKELRSHARLLREFVAEHLSDDRPLHAFAMWEGSR